MLMDQVAITRSKSWECEQGAGMAVMGRNYPTTEMKRWPEGGVKVGRDRVSLEVVRVDWIRDMSRRRGERIHLGIKLRAVASEEQALDPQMGRQGIRNRRVTVLWGTAQQRGEACFMRICRSIGLGLACVYGYNGLSDTVPKMSF